VHVQGDIFVQISAYLKLYCDYVNNYGLALQELLEAKKKSSTLADFLKVRIALRCWVVRPLPVAIVAERARCDHWTLSAGSAGDSS
jgi:hypothetical protein